MIELIDFLEFDDVMQQLKEHAAATHPDKKFVPFWSLHLDGNKLIIRSTVSDGKIGVPQGHVELVKDLEDGSN